jgi:ABC-type glutathione transport system ATPase component
MMADPFRYRYSRHPVAPPWSTQASSSFGGYFFAPILGAIDRPSSNPHKAFRPRMNRLEFRDVTMRFADASGRQSLTAIQGVSFAIADGEVVALI